MTWLGAEAGGQLKLVAGAAATLQQALSRFAPSSTPCLWQALVGRPLGATSGASGRGGLQSSLVPGLDRGQQKTSFSQGPGFLSPPPSSQHFSTLSLCQEFHHLWRLPAGGPEMLAAPPQRA